MLDYLLIRRLLISEKFSCGTKNSKQTTNLLIK